MALVTYLIAPCEGPSAILVEFSSSTLPVVGGNYFLTFVGSTDSGCYEIVDTAEPGVGIDTVATQSTNYNDCATCQGASTPTPTPSVTATVTPTVTKTPTVTPTPSLSGFALTGGTTNTSSGTIVYEDCITCSGDTTTQAMPHAIYSNAQGRAVVQVDSVALGGFNGLNS
mgnify:CR=1 FL=1